MPLENLVSVRGPLVETFSHLDPNTIQHADELTNARRTNQELRNQWLWTADGSIYTVEQDSCQHCGRSTEPEVMLYLTRGKDNPIFKNIQEATRQLTNNRNYVPKKEDLESAINSENTLKTKLSDLNLQRHDDEFSYFEVDTKNYNELNSEQRKVAERAYGQGNDFQKNMKMLKKLGINTTRVYVLTPNYVQEHTEKDSAVARACRLIIFDLGSDFGASGRYVVDSDDCLRGVPKEIAEGDAAENIVKLEEKAMLELLGDYTAPVNLTEVQTKLQKLYKK